MLTIKINKFKAENGPVSTGPTTYSPDRSFYISAKSVNYAIRRFENSSDGDDWIASMASSCEDTFFINPHQEGATSVMHLGYIDEDGNHKDIFAHTGVDIFIMQNNGKTVDTIKI